MSKPKKKEKKTAQELEALSSDEVMRYVFGDTGGQVLKDQLLRDIPTVEPDDLNTLNEV